MGICYACEKWFTWGSKIKEIPDSKDEEKKLIVCLNCFKAHETAKEVLT